MKACRNSGSRIRTIQQETTNERAEMTKKTKAQRKPPMTASANLAKDDLDALVACLVSLKKK